MSEIKWRSTGAPDSGALLSGLRVLEFSHVLAAPICGQLLADLGAEVIKVERPPKGDSQRWDVSVEDSLGPYSATFFTLNRGKRSLVLDLKKEEDRTVAMDLLADADVMLQNYRVGILDKLGFGFAELHKKFPRLVYCSVSGYGQTGPWKDRGGFDLVAQAMCGIMTFTGPVGSSEPIKCGPPITDIAAGILSSSGILAALYRRERIGSGDHVDVSLLDAGVMFTYLHSALALASNVEAKPMGSGHPLYTPYEAYPVQDGWIALGTANENNWRKLINILGSPEIGSDPRFCDTPTRFANREALRDLLSARFKTGGRDYWLDLLTEAGIPCGPVLEVKEMLQHPQVLHRQMVIDVPHPDGGTAKAIGCPIKFALAANPAPRPAPLLDQH